MTYPISKLLHLLLVPCANSSLVIAKNGDLTVTVIVKLHFLRDSAARAWIFPEFLEQLRHGVGRIVGTENLGSQPRHIAVEMLV